MSTQPTTNNLEEETRNGVYDGFIRNGLNVGFTDDQVDFLWDYIELITSLKIK